jgi:nucleotide-binding universal stress UspA family protein
MESIARIVCPVDLSNGSRNAVAHAATLARLHRAELHLLHVSGGGEPKSPGGAECARSVGLGVIVAAALWGPKGADPNDEVPLRLATGQGRPVKAIAAFARRIDADLIVIGAQYGAARSWVSGSPVPTALGRSAPCPVLVVAQPQHTLPAPVRIPFSDVLCAVDFTRASQAALQVAVGLVQRARGRLTLAHVAEGWPDRMIFSASGALRQLRAYQGCAGADEQRLRELVPARALEQSRVDALVVSGSPPEAILRAASEAGAALIVMGVTPRSAGSTARAVLRRATCPVLLVPVPATVARVETPASSDATRIELT